MFCSYCRTFGTLKSDMFRQKSWKSDGLDVLDASVFILNG